MKLLGKQELVYALVHAIVHAIVPNSLEFNVHVSLQHLGGGVKIVVSSVYVAVASKVSVTGGIFANQGPTFEDAGGRSSDEACKLVTSGNSKKSFKWAGQIRGRLC